ncbi:MAG: MarC family protein [Deltaproteobacteria bacterium]|nr:MarC family protein [Deltaproteobacteria bacterium]
MIVDFLRIFVAIFIIVDPIGLLPLFIALTHNYSKKRIKHTVQLACLTAAFVLIIFAFAGDIILEFFGITIPAFRIAGGIIIFIIALGMLQAKRTRLKTTPEEEEKGFEQEEVGIVPIGIPMLAGPGAITTVIVFTSSSRQYDTYITIAAIMLTLFFAFFILKQAVSIHRILGPTGLNIFTRLMGLILAVISVQFVIDGIKEFFLLS